ncbi:hypothetical protein MWU78_09130 [Arenibacter sp. F26102]|uniref:hypothetical protein n=1 Tax=Arenibacter sp. F26102 TaxID=2926416 RepID=UPI001FF3F3D9|nr:hypothetical protein [Arenibacter sp. F26102]MCK0145804.1 hypothetical protein [Arenibacter sp. F26102]
MWKSTIPLPLGSNVPIINSTESASSPASRLIIHMAHKLPAGQKLNVVVLGSCTNVASAILEDPSIVQKLKVHYLGFWHNVETAIVKRQKSYMFY